MIGESILNITGSLFLLLFSIQVFTTVRAYGKMPPKAVMGMMQVTLRSSKLILLVGAILGFFLVLFEPLLASWFPPFPKLFLTGLSLVALNGACLPPTFLYLAASRAKAFSLTSDLQLAIAPLKIVNLIDTIQAGVIPGDQIHQSDYRVSGNWQKAVKTLSRITPIIIVDGRITTQPLIQEITYIINSGLYKRTFFIGDETGKVPALSCLNLPRDIFPQIVTSQKLIKALKGIGFKFLLFQSNALVQLVKARLKKGRTDQSSIQELSVATRVKNNSDYSDTCDIRQCWRCHSKVWVNKHLPVHTKVCCMECVAQILHKSKKTPLWRFPFE